MTDPILPGAVLGVLGGGQLGRIFALAAREMGYGVHVFSPEAFTPAAQVADRSVHAPFEDEDAVEDFARGVDVVTFEFENVPAQTIRAAERHAPVRPNGALLAATQERLREKRALVQLGLPVAQHAAIESIEGLAAAAAGVGFPAILKTAAWGYDGKGQRRVDAEADFAPAYAELGRGRAVLERLVPFVAEISVVGARGLDGSIELFEPFLNHHANHILDVTLVPAPIDPATVAEAHAIARAVLEGFDVVGVLCVELFLLANGELLVNEVAPRTHNSGHVTLDAHRTSQFEQQVRAITGLPLGSVERLAPAAAMANLLGDLWTPAEPDWCAALADPGVRLHHYAKREPRPGRKMGHLAVLDSDPERAEARVRAARSHLVDALRISGEGPTWTRG
ncbi:MAG: 5-(carboxyamino)imidazole ribonucleotide synthase [Planctomycetota bacterium]